MVAFFDEAKGHSPGSWSRPMDRASAYLPSTSSAFNDDLEEMHGDLWWFMMIYVYIYVWKWATIGYAYQIIAKKNVYGKKYEEISDSPVDWASKKADSQEVKHRKIDAHTWMFSSNRWLKPLLSGLAKGSSVCKGFAKIEIFMHWRSPTIHVSESL